MLTGTVLIALKTGLRHVLGHQSTNTEVVYLENPAAVHQTLGGFQVAMVPELTIVDKGHALKEGRQSTLSLRGRNCC